jgi:hypothetical protein
MNRDDGTPEGFNPEQTGSYSILSTASFKPHIAYLLGK